MKASEELGLDIKILKPGIIQGKPYKSCRQKQCRQILPKLIPLPIPPLLNISYMFLYYTFISSRTVPRTP